MLQEGWQYGLCSCEACSNMVCVAAREVVNGLYSCKVHGNMAYAAAREVVMWPIKL